MERRLIINVEVMFRGREEIRLRNKRCYNSEEIRGTIIVRRGTGLLVRTRGEVRQVMVKLLVVGDHFGIWGKR